MVEQATTRAPFQDETALRDAMRGIVEVRAGDVEILDADRFRNRLLDGLAYSSAFSSEPVRSVARWLIRASAPKLGIHLASIHDLYLAAGRGEYSNATAPAINVRGFAYDNAQAIYRAAKASDTHILIIEIARSEMGYGDMRPAEFTAVILAGAIRAGWTGPVFLQGDHFQLKQKGYEKDPIAEVDSARDLTREAIEAGFYNIDIDASTIVDIDLPELADQQEKNYRHTAELTAFIRDIQPPGITVSVGGEIGEVGMRNSTIGDLHAFMEGYLPSLAKMSEQAGRPLESISKISVQTGTSHGGTVLPDGTIKKVAVDFDVLEALSKAAREDYGMGGAVQHGASTLDPENFDRFAQVNAIEVHLATAFQNIFLDSPLFPAGLKARMYAFLDETFAAERKPDMTDLQFHYKTRKNVFGPFKREVWDIPESDRDAIMAELEETYVLIMQRLGVANSRDLVAKHIKPVIHPVEMSPGVAAILNR